MNITVSENFPHLLKQREPILSSQTDKTKDLLVSKKVQNKDTIYLFPSVIRNNLFIFYPFEQKFSHGVSEIMQIIPHLYYYTRL